MKIGKDDPDVIREEKRLEVVDTIKDSLSNPLPVPVNIPHVRHESDRQKIERLQRERDELLFEVARLTKFSRYVISMLTKNRESSIKGGAASAKYTDDDHNLWIQMAKQYRESPGKRTASKSQIAKWICNCLKLPTQAEQSVRKKI